MISPSLTASTRSTGRASRAFFSLLTPLLAGSAAVMFGSGCGLKEESPFDPAVMQQLYRSKAEGTTSIQLKPLPTDLNKEYLTRREGIQPTSRPLPTTQESIGKVVRFNLRDLIQLAALNSLDVRVAGYQPAIDEARVTESEANFDVTFFTNLTTSSQWVLQPSPQNIDVGSGDLRFDSIQMQTGLKQNLPTGGQVQLGYTYNKTFRNRATQTFNPSHESDLVLQITQPLLRNFGLAVNRARIDVARNTQKVSLLDFRLALEKNLSEIEEAYWQLVAAERDLMIQERLFNETVETSKVLQARLGQMDVTRVQIGQSNAALRAREVSLVQARTRIKTLSNAIKRRVNDPALPLTSPVTILPSDTPLTTPIQFDLLEQIDTALTNRAELTQQRIRIDSARIVQDAAKNNLLPTLNLVLSLGTQGARNSEWDSVEQAASMSFPQYSIGLQLEVPLGNREARAIWRRTQLQQYQAIDQYRVLIEQVAQEVKDAYDSLADGWERIRTGRQSVLAAREALEAIQTEQKVGQQALTPDFINRLLQQQEVLANAEREENRAIADYNVAVAQLERAKGTILKYDNVMMAEDPQTVNGPNLYGPLKTGFKK